MTFSYIMKILSIGQFGVLLIELNSNSSALEELLHTGCSEGGTILFTDAILSVLSYPNWQLKGLYGLSFV